MQSSYIPRARSLAVALVLVLFGIVFFAGSAHAQADIPSGQTVFEAWSPLTSGWVSGNAKGYSEGETVAFLISNPNGVEGVQLKAELCLTYQDASGYRFIGLEPWDKTESPTNHSTGGPLPLTDELNSLVEARHAVVNNVIFNGLGPGGGNNCATNQLWYTIVFTPNDGDGTPNETIRWWLVVGGHLAQAGDPLPTGKPGLNGGLVPTGQGAGAGTGTFSASLANASKTIPFSPGDIIAPTADIKATKSCPNFYLSSPYKFRIEVTNLGPSGSQNVQIVDTLPSSTQLQVLGITSTYYNTANPTGIALPAASCVQGGTAAAPTVTCSLSYGTPPQVPLLESIPQDSAAKWVVEIEVWDLTTTPTSVSNSVAVSALTPQPTGTTANDTETCSTTTPVTLSSFKSAATDGAVEFEWSTATEFANGGFNLYVETAGGRTKVNGQMIPSKVVDSTTPQVYSYAATVPEGTTFYVEDVSAWGERTLHGPYILGESYGSVPETDPIDWGVIWKEHESKEAARAAESAVEPAVAPASIEFPVVSQAFLPLVAIAGDADSAAGPNVQLQLKVDRIGLHRVTYEDLLAAGFDLKGARAADLALTNRGSAVAIRVGGPATFGPGSFIEFHGVAYESLYTRTNVYLLQAKGGTAARVQVDATAPDLAQSPATFYMHTVTVENNRDYSYLAPNGDPWYDQMLLAYANAPKTWTYSIPVNNYVAGVEVSRLGVDVWGVSNLIAGFDHRLIASFNGEIVADELFDGLVHHPVEATIPAAAVKPGANSLALTVPGDRGNEFDMSVLNAYSLTYPRAFVAQNGSLAFTAAAGLFKVTGLPSNEVQVYRMDATGPVLLSNVQVTQSGTTYDVTFAGRPEGASYVVYAKAALLKPAIAALRPKADITSGKADYVIISHPDFKNGLSDLVATRRVQGLKVSIADVFDVYDQFSYGIVDPQAIQSYIAHAVQNMGAKYILLVGGDTYDYFKYKSNSISFVPTPYAATGDYLPFAPVDSLFADVDGDSVPDVALGRLPVRTSAELSAVITKTLKYEQATGYGGSAVFAADHRFGGDSEAIIAKLPAGWSIERAYLDNQTVADAKASLMNRINQGAALTSFVGHSGPTKWTFSDLFSAGDVASLNNADRPTIVVQWGCWNTYHVEPAYNTLGHRFMLTEGKGAAAVMGSSAVGYSHTQALLGQAIAARLAQPGMTIGNAVLEAKKELAADGTDMRDVILGWTIQGDPALRVKAQ